MDWILKNTKQIYTIQIQSQKKFDYKYLPCINMNLNNFH